MTDEEALKSLFNMQLKFDPKDIKQYNIAWSQRDERESRYLWMKYAHIVLRIKDEKATPKKPLKVEILTTEKAKEHAEAMKEKLIQMLTYSHNADKVSIKIVTSKADD